MLKRASDILPGNRTNPELEAQPAGLSMIADGLDLREFVRIARRRVPLVIFTTLIGLLLGAVYASQLQPLYTAKATILIDLRQKNVADGDSVIAGISGDVGAIESEIELIKSYDVAARVVDKLKLAEEFANVSASREPSLFSQLMAIVLGKREQAEPDLLVDNRAIAIEMVKANVDVQRRGWAYVLDISYVSDNPSKSAQIASAFADEYLVEQLESRYEATKRANSWLTERVDELRQKVRESESAVATYKAENNIVESAGTTLNDQQIGKLNEQLILARAETAQVRAKYEQVQAVRKRGGDVTAFADALQSGALGALKAKSSEVRRELANLSAKYGSRHPSVVSARAQLSDINGQIGAEASRIVTATQNEYRVARSREDSIEASLAELKGSANIDNRAEIKLRELEREAEANKALFESFLTKFKETTEQEKLDTTDSKIIEKATAPRRPSAPNKRLIALLATTLGLAIGVAIAFLLEQLDSGYRTNRQIEKDLGVPVLASVPRADGELDSSFLSRLNPFSGFMRMFRRGDPSERRMSKSGRVAMSRLVVDKPFSSFTESIRSLRMGIKFADVDKQHKTILITSALPGEGKSTIASNLAVHAANSGERVLLIDLDLRHPVLTSLFAPEAQVGSVELLLGEADLNSVITKEPRSGLHFIPSPRRSDLTHTAELLGSQRLRDLLTHTAKYYDLVVIDTSPLLPVTDGRALMDAVDSFVMVVRWEKTNKDAVTSALKETPGWSDVLTGVVLNDVVASKARYYDYYKSGYYNKKYPYYYGGKS